MLTVMNEFCRVSDLTMAGRDMGAAEARQLESVLEANPEDLDARVKLIGFHFGKDIWNRQRREQLCKHIFWLVQNCPHHEILKHPEARPHFYSVQDELYERGKQLWNEQVSKHSDSAVVLVNASRFFNHSDWDRAISLLEASLELDPQNTDIKEKLAFACELRIQIR